MDGETLIYRSIGEIAARDGISKQAVSKTVKRLLETAELPVERDGRGRIVKVSLAHYDHARERLTNPAKSPVRAETDATITSPATRPVAVGDSFDEARRQAEWLKVGREKLRHQAEVGLLVRADMLAEALTTAGREIQTIMMRLPNRADDLALAVSKEGQHGARLLLRTIATDLCGQFADRLAQIAAPAPENDDLIRDEP